MRRELLNKLIRLREEGPLLLGRGICANITTNDDMEDVMEGLFLLWPGFSGCTSHPVEGSLYKYCYFEDKWNNPVYGEKRKNLLDFLINALQNELNDSPAL